MRSLHIYLLLLIFNPVYSQISFEEFKQVTGYHDEKSYILAFPKLDYRVDSARFDFQEGEGKKVILEAKIAGVYDIFRSNWKKKNDTCKAHWRIAVAGNVALRLTKDKILTSPSLPPNNKFGLRFDVGWKDKVDSNLPGIFRKVQSVTNFIRFDMFHYSNGQADVGYDSVQNRISLRNGDFSTNYLRLSFGSTSLSPTKSDSTTKLEQRTENANKFSSYTFYLQRDGRPPGGLGELFDFLPGDGNYGKWRVGGTLHIPDYLSSLRLNSSRGLLFSYNLDYEFVLDKLIDNSIPKISVTGRLVWHPFRFPSGIMLYTHFGRDYMNIRYTVPDFMFINGVGIYLQNF